MDEVFFRMDGNISERESVNLLHVSGDGGAATTINLPQKTRKRGAPRSPSPFFGGGWDD